jgi:hypothetical protein
LKLKLIEDINVLTASWGDIRPSGTTAVASTMIAATPLRAKF